MKKLVALSSEEAILLQAALSHWAYHLSKSLHDQTGNTNKEDYLSELDTVDYLKSKLQKTFFK